MNDAEGYQRRVAALLLDAIGPVGFALAGASAIREHGLTSRPTEDVDLFAASTTSAEEFGAAVTRAERALREQGYKVVRRRSFPLYARLLVEDAAGTGLDVDLGVDWRHDPPVRLALGPVLSANDAVASKIGAVYSRGEARDFLDVDAIRRSGRFTDAELLRLASEHDDGFEQGMFAAQLSRVTQIEPDEVSEYGIDTHALNNVKQRLLDWASLLRDDRDGTP